MINNETPIYLIAIFVAWLGAHAAKYLVSYFGKEKRNFSSMFASGGMPSSHSATVMSLATVIGLKDGFYSGFFGIAALFALIVMYDATKVRFSSGEQGLAIHEIIKEQNSNIKLPKISKGHTLLEVVIGAFLGVVIGMIVFLATK